MAGLAVQPAIVLMLAVGRSGAGHRDIPPERDIGALVQPMISLAVVILFEGGLTLNLRQLADARLAVRRGLCRRAGGLALVGAGAESGRRSGLAGLDRLWRHHDRHRADGE